MLSESNFLLISDPEIWAVSVRECGEPLVDLNEFDIQISPIRASFYTGFTKVRTTVAEKLMEVQKKLPAGLRILFSEGHRPISLQRQMFDEYCQQLILLHPDWDQKLIQREATKLIASPDDVPPHSTGGAIDLTLLDENGEPLDMGSLIDEDPQQNGNRNYTFSAHISAHARANRKILCDALNHAGFVNYPAEWWHWSYGDKYWAYQTRHPHAIYGSV